MQTGLVDRECEALHQRQDGTKEGVGTLGQELPRVILLGLFLNELSQGSLYVRLVQHGPCARGCAVTGENTGGGIKADQMVTDKLGCQGGLVAVDSVVLDGKEWSVLSGDGMSCRCRCSGCIRHPGSGARIRKCSEQTVRTIREWSNPRRVFRNTFKRWTRRTVS